MTRTVIATARSSVVWPRISQLTTAWPGLRKESMIWTGGVVDSRRPVGLPAFQHPRAASIAARASAGVGNGVFESSGVGAHPITNRPMSGRMMPKPFIGAIRKPVRDVLSG